MIFSEVSARLFPWDFIDEDPDKIMDDLSRDTLTNSFYPVILMHDEKRPLSEFYFPHNPKRKVYWQGPSIGFDFGGNAAQSMTLVYGIKNADDIYKRYPGISGSFYFVAGVGVNYQQNGDVILAPMRTGMGLRVGANAGYLHYGREHSWIPF